ncbi:MAG TPA: 3-deoxy-D-manno-octulosonic acid transferase [Alphaproteobacteria bacterium]|jgi:3-deoxy-D-manno-octulosonic-acid transferase
MSALYHAARGLYRGLTAVAGPAVTLYLRRRLARGKEDPARFHERFGEARVARPAGRLVWLHAASIGEAFSVLRLIDRLLVDHPALHVLITTGTVSSAQLLGNRLPPRAIHQYVPVDRMAWVRRFLDHWRPDAALWVESEIWPNLIGETRARGVPMLLLNARISPKSFAGWQRVPGIARALFGGFARCLAQDEDEAGRLRALGARDVRVTGNLKNADRPLPADPAGLVALRDQIGARPVWIAASTHDGEEAMVAEAQAILARARPTILTIIAPRHPPRGPEIAAQLRARGLGVACRSAHEPIAPDTAIYLADTLGELGLLYRVAPIAFIGGSLVPRGGQNMLEPARLDAAIVAGPHMENFRAMARDMDAADAWLRVGDAASLAAAVDRLLADDILRERLIMAAQRVASRQDDVLDRVAAEVAPFLAFPEAAHARA